jgi:uncharacterized membrane protein
MKGHKHSIFKSILWRILGVIILAAVTYFYTHNWITVGLVTIIHHATFLLVFYLHERVWTKIKLLGKKRNIIKALFYELVLGMGLGGLIVYLVTGSFARVTQITLTYTAIKIVTYFFYDRCFPEIKNT